MNQVENKLMSETQTTLKKIIDFLIGFLGSLLVGNLGLILFAQFDPQRLWISYFQWVWILGLASLAVIMYARNRMWISIGVVVAMILMAF